MSAAGMNFVSLALTFWILTPRKVSSSICPATSTPLFFATPAAFRGWLKQNHANASELWVGFYKKDSGHASITWPESVDEALCVGWIDGIRKRWDEESYVIRFTPRKQRSTWSSVNIARVAELTRRKQMKPAGIAAFERRTETNSEIYAYEQRANAALDAEAEREFRAQGKAWDFFQAQAPSYRKLAAWWVISAKRDETRRARIAKLISQSAAGRRI